MDFSNILVYIASPLFTPPQNAMLDELESLLTELEIPFFSPRQDGGDLSKMSPEERSAAARRIFKSNIDHLDKCNVYLINIDDRDTGTAFEFGYGYAKQQEAWLEQGVFGEKDAHLLGLDKLLVTFSSSGYGLNIMLNDASEAHFPQRPDMFAALRQLAAQDGVATVESMRDFFGSVTGDLKSNTDVE